MYERRHEALAHRQLFYARLLRSSTLGAVAIFLAMLIGSVGYYYFEDMSAIDAFSNAAMILSGMGPLSPLHSFFGKLFAGFYALFSGLFFILIVGLIFAPIIHRFFHKFHLDEKSKK